MSELRRFYEKAKNDVINDCIKCGNCIHQCKAIKLTQQNLDAEKVQSNLIGFLRGDEPLSQLSLQKVDACMGCFGCLDIPCKIGVSSMLINEMVKWELSDKKDDYTREDIYPTHMDLARKNTTRDDFERITTPVLTDTDYLFFPGCNVYNQPDKLLNALTIMDRIGTPYSFAPGLDFCCGFARGCMGDAEWMEKSALKLIALAEGLKIKTMILWCPTCLCVFEDRIKKFRAPAFNCISFGQYVFKNIDKLSFPCAKKQTVTYHEPCKTAYLGFDLQIRQILKAIPGTRLAEMAHHGRDTMCCGCDAVNNAPALGTRITAKRLEEAAATNCDTMIDTCHYCHQVFSDAIRNNDLSQEIRNLSIENYATFITRAMGTSKLDTLFKKD